MSDLEHDIIQLRSQLATKKAEEATARTAADTLVVSIRESGVNPLTDKAAFTQVDEAYMRSDAIRDEISGLQNALSRGLSIIGEKADGPTNNSNRREARDFAGRIVQSTQYARLRESGLLSSSNPGVRMDPVEVATREEFLDILRLRTTVDNSQGSGGGLIWSDRLGIVVPMVGRKVRLLDLITIGTTDTDTVEYARQSVKTDTAAETPYGTTLPESAYGWVKDSTMVKRIGHWVPATKGAVADGGQLKTLLDNQLMSGHLRRVEQQMWNGNGTGENLIGILDATRTGLQTQARSAMSYHDVFHKAITKIRLANLDNDYEPTAFVINPVDYESIVLEKDSTGNYLNERGVVEIPTLWGLTPVVTNLAASGSALVGDFTQATAWIREGIQIGMSDQHSDFWLKGLVAIKSEGRLAFDVLMEAAFVKVTGL